MKRKIIMNLAISLDGYIADPEGGFDWIAGDGDTSLDTAGKWDYAQFLETVDVVVMGRHCYEQKMHLDFPDKTVYIATSESLENRDNLRFVNGDIVGAVLEEATKSGKDIFLFGGGKLVDHFIKANVIDTFIIGIIPIILGSGRPLFLGDNPKTELHLDEQINDQGVVILKYSRR